MAPPDPPAQVAKRISLASRPDDIVSADEAYEAAICHAAGAPPFAITAMRDSARTAGVSISQDLIAQGWLDPEAYCQALARDCNFIIQNEAPSPWRFQSQPAEPWRVLVSRRAVPIGASDSLAAICAESFPAGALRYLAGALGPARRKIALVSKAGLTAAMARGQTAALLGRAIFGLNRLRPEESALQGVWLWQSLSLAAVTGAFGGALLVAPQNALVAASACCSLMFLLSVFLRLGAALHALRRMRRGPKAQAPPLAEKDLPRYSVIVPLFREAQVLPSLLSALARLDYPAAKLDIKIVLESIDADTIAAARAAPLPGNAEIVIVPDKEPRTKPKACNYALQFATGELAVVFDAEDQPEPSQLRKAAAVFASAPADVVCLQARLEYHNHSENWLSRQFAIEYVSLFSGVLPFMEALRLPMPLGGTSNHFRIKTLREAGAWDAFNVTEDADLGMRLHRAGLRCAMLDSTTYEEAACQPGNWLRQRSRWLKGWMQTYGVHMRRPWRLFRQLGAAGFLAFQAHFASVILSALTHPIFYMLLIADILMGEALRPPQNFLSGSLWHIALFNFAAGYVSSAMLGAACLKARGLWFLTPNLIFIPLYWMLISAAAYRALWQLIVAPFHWDKTDHRAGALARPVLARPNHVVSSTDS